MNRVSDAKAVPYEVALQATNLSVSFGKVGAVQGLDLTLAQGGRHALIGPNGAGKTTLVNLLMGSLAPDQGAIFLGGHDVTGLRTDERSRRGMVRTFQVSSLFPGLTATQTLVLAICERTGVAAHWWRALHKQAWAVDEAAYRLDQLDLTTVAHTTVGQLSYGQQRMLEIALALACRPRVLVLDEPAAGLSDEQSRAMLAVINALPDDISVLLIEHDMDLVFGFAHTISVLVDGRILATGTPDQIRADADVRAIYLGKR